ncbi:MAG TPA: aldehyde:ferredoxin oxidoreductase, partial [Firmicutes bacterium]|nr:aldehyde:ferredoxin oxidoreductase [Bacillota bacterium]
MFPEAKILDVNLTTGKIDTVTLPGNIHKQYPGGSSLGMYFLLKETEPGIDPLSEDNILVFSVSPLTGLPISGQSRMTVTTKSPLTGGAGDSQAGGYFPAYFRANGYNALLIRGKAKNPVYLYIDKDDVRLIGARDIWGKVTGEAEDTIKAVLKNKKVQILTIGPAGENLVKFSNIMHMKNRAFGRNGTGAVMGSKKLKAIVAKNNPLPKPENQGLFKELTGNVKQRVDNNETCADMKINGTATSLAGLAVSGYLPTKNWQSGWFKGWEQLTGPRMVETIKVGDETCYGCAIACKQVVEIEGKVDRQYGGPEYETLAAFGSYCDVNDLNDVAYANMLCNMYGLDTISCGATLAFAMECYEKGLLSKNDTDGLELNFGNSSIFHDAITNIAYRKGGLGRLLAEGSYRAAEAIGNGAVEFAMTCKKQELPAHMPQHKPSLAVIYAVNPFGADHESSEHDPAMRNEPGSRERSWMSQVGGDFTIDAAEETELNYKNVIWGYRTQLFYAALETLCLCHFAWGVSWQLYGPKDLIKLCE